ncbi:MAG: esterase [Bacteroidetes bacterium MedPE-SWsnd-G2]|nr:MAG: esterase [Bacteroidetes bacterium MedPE-SWsnd-G2]
MAKKLSILTVLLLTLQWSFSQGSSQLNRDYTFNLHSNILNETRTCIISFPENYWTSEKLTKSYPIVILLDGATFFKSTSSTIQFMSSDRNRNYFMQESILVAIENVDRERDFTMTKIKTKRPNTMGGGANFLAFITTELLPYLKTNYRTKTHTSLIGHSLGGLLTLNAYLSGNESIDAFLSIDPSIWWDEELMQSKINAIPASVNLKHLYIATANQGEANYTKNKKRHDHFFNGIKTKFPSNSYIKLEYFKNESHRSVPLIAIYSGLKFVNTEN